MALAWAPLIQTITAVQYTNVGDNRAEIKAHLDLLGLSSDVQEDGSLYITGLGQLNVGGWLARGSGGGAYLISESDKETYTVTP